MTPPPAPDISILIPCYNEEDGIAHVLRQNPCRTTRRLDYRVETLVIDNNSTDGTARVAAGLGARVISEPRKGKGHALKTGLSAVHPASRYIVIIDGDDTYKLTELFRMIEPLESNFCDIVVGSRLGGRMLDKAFSTHHRVANWFFTFLVRHFYGANITDTLSGYISMRADVARQIHEHLTVPDFRIEMELITRAVRMGYSLTSVPITYDKRRGTSKLVSWPDGARILHTLVSNFGWRRPDRTGDAALSARQSPVPAP